MKIKLLIGLGNPGSEYQNTYHNVGQLFIDYLAGALPSGRQEGARFRSANYFESLELGDLTLVKTLTFMNRSGGAVLKAKRHFNCRSKELLVVHDDSDIALGNFKLSFNRGPAGHQGVSSIIKALRAKNFYRLRIGIRSADSASVATSAKGAARRVKAGDLVLSKIPSKEEKVLKDLFRELGARYFKVDTKGELSVGSGRKLRER